jgi:phosphatidylglycerophosphate synthase
LKPVQVSFCGAFIALLTIPAYAHTLRLGGVMVFLSGFFDSLNGALARKTRQFTKAGSFIDSTLDRYGDCFYLVGVWVYFACADPAKMVVFTGLTFFVCPGSIWSAIPVPGERGWAFRFP